MTSYPQMYKTFNPWFSLHVFVNFMLKKTYYYEIWTTQININNMLSVAYT